MHMQYSKYRSKLLALGLGDKIVAAYGLDGDVREDLKDEFDKIQYMDTKPSKEEVVRDGSSVLLRHGILLSVMTGFLM